MSTSRFQASNSRAISSARLTFCCTLTTNSFLAFRNWAGSSITEDTEEQENVGRLRETCARLIKCIVETIRTRLDRLYLEALGDASRSGKMVQAAAEDVAAAREELESLYAEILPVAQISVEQQYLEPALKSLSGQNGQRAGRSIEATRYVSSVLRPPSARIAIYLSV